MTKHSPWWRAIRHLRLAVLLPLATLGTALGLATDIQPSAAHHQPAIWVGSPVKGTWGLAGQPGTTPAGGHHKLVKANPQNDWAVDLTNIPNTNRAAYLYVAPSNSGLNNRVTTTVHQIIDNNVCRLGGGGDLVTIAIRLDGTVVGHVSYAHLDRNPNLRVGQRVGRWGTWLGNAANLTAATSGGSGCWTGRHVHFEARASSHYACWNKGYTPGYRVNRTNFLGFTTGPLNSYATRCP